MSNSAPTPTACKADEARIALCIHATYQIEAMSNALMKAARDNPDGSFPSLAQGLAVRIHQLNSVIMQTLDDDSDPEIDLLCNVYGRHALTSAEAMVQ